MGHGGGWALFTGLAPAMFVIEFFKDLSSGVMMKPLGM
jgi:hypothetical protein